jgi:D-alanyl-D-alanine carboxypeptidase/D-alanyl-D-alanine endopeptidase (penicillin-binding protein 7)
MLSLSHPVLKFLALAALLCVAQASRADVVLNSQRALVVDEATGEVLLEKNANDSAPMASLSKLLTAIVVLDANQDPDELLTIEEADLDTLKHTHSGVRVGQSFTRSSMLELALLTSDNHAASSLARHYPGGLPAFVLAAAQKIESLKLLRTTLVEPTGLSPENRSSATDLVAVLAAASAYPDIARITSQASTTRQVSGELWTLKNTNALVGKKGWDILLSKTGFTNEAGRCLAMRLRTAGRTVLVVLMDAAAGASRTQDALNVLRLVTGDEPLSAQVSRPTHGAGTLVKANSRKRSRTRVA